MILYTFTHLYTSLHPWCMKVVPTKSQAGDGETQRCHERQRQALNARANAAEPRRVKTRFHPSKRANHRSLGRSWTSWLQVDVFFQWVSKVKMVMASEAHAIFACCSRFGLVGRVHLASMRVHFAEENLYSEKYQDDKYEYRHVIMNQVTAQKVWRLTNGMRRLMPEHEWRAAGVTDQTHGWIHYEVHAPEPHILLFRRPLPNPHPDKVEVTYQPDPEKVAVEVPYQPDQKVMVEVWCVPSMAVSSPWSAISPRGLTFGLHFR